MAQNCFTTLLHKTIIVVMSAGVIIAYDTEKLSFKCYMITSGLKVAISHLKKWHFSMGVLGNSWSNVWELAILLGVCLIHDCARVANGPGDSIKNYKLASLFWKTKYFICLFRDIYLSWFFKRANLFDISFYWIYEWRHLSICLSGFLC